PPPPAGRRQRMPAEAVPPKGEGFQPGTWNNEFMLNGTDVLLNGTDILESLIEPEQGSFSADLARYVLSLKFSPRQQARFEELSYKVQDGALSGDEERELDAFLAAETLLIVLKSKATRSLDRHSPAA
ncbi:MAG TPA: hypothetical protein VG269_26480, partial [Tepidisphaeraceae bacterium]|nr:hypothetical protein [Tepidisphaeraceae bacterium]